VLLVFLLYRYWSLHLEIEGGRLRPGWWRMPMVISTAAAPCIAAWFNYINRVTDALGVGRGTPDFRPS
jgi:hypothetical protein